MNPKPPKAPVRIAPNDPALAHAMAAHEIEKFAQGTDKAFDRIFEGPRTVTHISKVLHDHYGPLLLSENITRPKGSRAKARWVLLDALAEGQRSPDALGVMHVTLDKQRLGMERLPVQISSHVVARLFHRTLGSSDLRGAALLYMHIGSAVQVVYDDAGTVKVDDNVETVTSDGAVLWKVIKGEPIELRAMTWIGVDTAVDPRLQQLMRDAGDTVAVSLTKA